MGMFHIGNAYPNWLESNLFDKEQSVLRALV
ncbi:hypothetical protein PMI37_01228 [Pseudomonas sp. GM80]|nr:hypothetical protein PMI37_01228 [Pseudomonas sp. GM80]